MVSSSEFRGEGFAKALDGMAMLNPEYSVRDICQRRFHTGVLTCNCGLAAGYNFDHPAKGGHVDK